MAVARAVERNVASTMARAVVVEVVRVLALACCRIWHCVCRLGHPCHGGAGENGRESRPPPHAALLLTLSLLLPPMETATDGSLPSAAAAAAVGVLQ